MTQYVTLVDGSGNPIAGESDGQALLWDINKKQWRKGAVAASSGGANTTDDVTNLSSVAGATATAAFNSLLATIGDAQVKRGANLGNVDSTISFSSSLWVLPAATLTANRVYTIDRLNLLANTPAIGGMIYVLCLDQTAFTKTIRNGGAGGGDPLVIAASQVPALYTFVDDGTNWLYVPSVLRMTPN